MTSSFDAAAMKRSARPQNSASLALIAAAVSARKRPLRPGMWFRNQLPPTSGNRAMVISGMAMRVFSHTTRWEQPARIPLPPPMTMPAPQHKIGLG
jgi:hypothetical protein